MLFRMVRPMRRDGSRIPMFVQRIPALGAAGLAVVNLSKDVPKVSITLDRRIPLLGREAYIH